MKILVLGAAGMIGRKLCERLAQDGRLGGKTITALHMVDVVAPSLSGAPFAAGPARRPISRAPTSPRACWRRGRT